MKPIIMQAIIELKVGDWLTVKQNGCQPAIGVISLFDVNTRELRFMDITGRFWSGSVCPKNLNDLSLDEARQLFNSRDLTDINLLSSVEVREVLHLGYTACGCPSPSPQTHDLYTLTQVGFWLKRLCEGKEIAIKTTLPLEFIEGIKETQKLLKEREELCKKMDDISKLISK